MRAHWKELVKLYKVLTYTVNEQMTGEKKNQLPTSTLEIENWTEPK